MRFTFRFVFSVNQVDGHPRQMTGMRVTIQLRIALYVAYVNEIQGCLEVDKCHDYIYTALLIQIAATTLTKVHTFHCSLKFRKRQGSRILSTHQLQRRPELHRNCQLQRRGYARRTRARPYIKSIVV